MWIITTRFHGNGFYNIGNGGFMKNHDECKYIVSIENTAIHLAFSCNLSLMKHVAILAAMCTHDVIEIWIIHKKGFINIMKSEKLTKIN